MLRSCTSGTAPVKEGDDLYFDVTLDGKTYTFTVESYPVRARTARSTRQSRR